MYSVQVDFDLPTLQVEQHLYVNNIFKNSISVGIDFLPMAEKKHPFKPLKGFIHT